jgi:hypothetical protein
MTADDVRDAETADPPPVLPASGRATTSSLELLAIGQDDRGRRVPRIAGLRMLPRPVLIALWAVALGVIAAAGGVLTHRSDVHGVAAAADQRLLVHLVGGEPVVALLDDETGTSNASSLPVRLDVTLRNDGHVAEQVVSAGVQQPGVVQDAPVTPVTIPPGSSADIAVRLTLACDRVDLAVRPDSIRIGLRGSGGRPVFEVFGFHAVQPSLPAAALYGQDGTLEPTLNYFSACAEGIQRAPLSAVYSGAAVAGVGTDLAYQLTVAAPDQWARLLIPPQVPDGLSGLGIRITTDLDGPVHVDASQAQNVIVTTKVADCTLAKRAIASEGLENFLLQVEGGYGLSSTPADPRFRDVTPVGLSLSLGFEHSPVSLDQDFLTWLERACPGL